MTIIFNKISTADKTIQLIRDLLLPEEKIAFNHEIDATKKFIDIVNSNKDLSDEQKNIAIGELISDFISTTTCYLNQKAEETTDTNQMINYLERADACIDLNLTYFCEPDTEDNHEQELNPFSQNPPQQQSRIPKKINILGSDRGKSPTSVVTRNDDSFDSNEQMTNDRILITERIVGDEIPPRQQFFIAEKINNHGLDHRESPTSVVTCNDDSFDSNEQMTNGGIHTITDTCGDERILSIDIANSMTANNTFILVGAVLCAIIGMIAGLTIGFACGGIPGAIIGGVIGIGLGKIIGGKLAEKINDEETDTSTLTKLRL